MNRGSKKVTTSCIQYSIVFIVDFIKRCQYYKNSVLFFQQISIFQSKLMNYLMRSCLVKYMDQPLRRLYVNIRMMLWVFPHLTYQLKEVDMNLGDVLMVVLGLKEVHMAMALTEGEFIITY